ncbi:MAG: RNA polymerase sigma factor [Myxococcota bacterium]
MEHLAVPDDAELVRRVLAGDRWAEEALYWRHAARLGNLAARLLRDRDAALDVVQDTFVQAFEGLGRLRDPERVGGWLRQITVHQVHRRLRRRALRRRLGLLPRGTEKVLAPAGRAAMETSTELRLVEAALREIGADARLCWCLRFVEGYRVAEVAEATGLSESTVKRRLRDAERRVRQHVTSAGEIASGEDAP